MCVAKGEVGATSKWGKALQVSLSPLPPIWAQINLQKVPLTQTSFP